MSNLVLGLELENDEKKSATNILMVFSNNDGSLEYAEFLKITSYLNKKKIKVHFVTKLGGEFKIKGSDSCQTSISLENIDPDQFDGILIPSCRGVYKELRTSDKLGYILTEFNKCHKIICAVGFGVGSLMSAKTSIVDCKEDSPTHNTHDWVFQNRSLTGVTMKEMYSFFKEKGPFIETQVLFQGGNFVASSSFSQPHIIIDSNLLTAQNEASYDLILHIFTFQINS